METPLKTPITDEINNHLNNHENEAEANVEENKSKKTTATEKPKATKKPKKVDTKAKQEIVNVPITISGATYSVNCPVNEQDELEKAVLYINHFIRSVRKSAPTLSYENLLVLCCLNMYEEMRQQRNAQENIRENDKQMKALIDKITRDARSIL